MISILLRGRTWFALLGCALGLSGACVLSACSAGQRCQMGGTCG